MAGDEFPWHGQSQEGALNTLSEKFPEVPQTNGDQSKHLGDIPNTRSVPASPEKQVKKQNSVQSKHRSSVSNPSGSRAVAVKTSVEAKSHRLRSTPLPVRTIPAWIRDANEDDVDDEENIIPDTPDVARLAQHHHSGSASQQPLLSRAQAERRAYPTSSGELRPEPTSRWISFARASIYPRENFNTEKVTPQWLNVHMTDYSRAWMEGRDDAEDEFVTGGTGFKKRRKVWYRRAQHTILRNPFIPLVFRTIVLTFAIVALALGAAIYGESNKVVHCILQSPRTPYCLNLVGPGEQEFYSGPSAEMAIIVDAIAIVYLLYITYDEYFSKPLGLRPARAKIRLVLLDLFFIIFQSANLSLSFSYLAVDDGPCKGGPTPQTANRYDNICDHSGALSSVLTVSVTAWFMTFSISVLRLVERINT